MESPFSSETLAIALTGLLATGGSAAAHELFSSEPVAPAAQIAHKGAEQRTADDEHEAAGRESDGDKAADKSGTAESHGAAAMPEGSCGAAHMKANEGKCGGHR